ncbi:hypothetical protein MYAM1_003232 [Malassezia yamatoensis]|uniref:Vacuolar protein sorting-associated protein 9a n=1 Tax=Malassezia yamatoensis TaxID=253288 RepID=A0AAJ6CHN4_9BASI|nr:hypothetical protein MYAM1_003232 [Malassezia yamatoensis]
MAEDAHLTHGKDERPESETPASESSEPTQSSMDHKTLTKEEEQEQNELRSSPAEQNLPVNSDAESTSYTKCPSNEPLSDTMESDHQAAGEVKTSSPNQVSFQAQATPTSASPADTDADVSQDASKGTTKDKIESSENSSAHETPKPSQASMLKSNDKTPVPQPIAPKPFDFNRFLEQMKHRSAIPVNEYVRSFFRGFTKRPYKPADQVKLIYDFLDFIAARMAEASVWARLSDEDFDQATEAMEKLLMNRLYSYTFPPAIQQEGHWSVQTNDLDRDQVLTRRIALLSWIEERHLDMPVGTHSARFTDFAVQELSKINHYRAPRDKIICILNCCKVIFGLIRHLDKEENADAFVPLLILVILRANPPHLVSNLEYIMRFKNPRRSSSEADYYLSSLAGAVSFIESLDHTALTNVSEEEFDQQVQFTSSALDAQAAANRAQDPDLPLHAQMAAVSLADDARAFLQRTGEAARTGFSVPITTLGKLLYERIDEALAPSEPVQTPVPRPPSIHHPQRGAAPNAPIRPNSLALLDEDDPRSEVDSSSSPFHTPNRPRPWRNAFVPHSFHDGRESPSEHVVAASHRGNPSQTQDHDEQVADNSIDWEAATQTLKSIFPNAEDSVLLLVLQENNGNVEVAIDRLLEMT